MIQTTRPINITADRNKKEMAIIWSDGHFSIYSFSLLRHACPCAECRGGHDKMGAEPDPSVFDMPQEDTPAAQLSSVEAVGAYALTISWEDGHHYGIYTWHYLRALCPCRLCRG